MTSTARSTTSFVRVALRAASTLAAYAAVTWVLVRSGDVLVLPADVAPSTIAAWIERHGLAHATIATLRLLSVGLCVYVALLVSLAIAARTTRAPSLLRASAVVTPKAWRGALSSLLGLGVSLAVLSTPAGAQPSASAPVVMHEIEDDATVGTRPDTAPPVMVLVEGSPVDRATSAATPPAMPATADPTVDDARVWIVEQGDHLWGVADRVLSEAWSTPPDDTQIAAYLDELVRQNRDVLVVPDDPDLVFAGQAFALPPPPPAPS